MNRTQRKKAQHALEQLRYGRLEEARAIYRALIKEGVTSPTIFGNLAAICGMQGKTQEMIPWLRKAIAVNPNYAEAYSNLGIALTSQGDLQAAIDSFRQALAIKPHYPEAYFNLGIALKEQGNLQAAIDCYRQALAINPNYPQAYNNLGIYLKEQGDLQAAIDAFHQALAIKPHYPEAYFNLGIALKEQGNLQAAIDAYRQALAINPNHAEAYNNLGIALKKQGDLQAAIDAYRKALAIKPNYAETYNNLGIVLKKQGDLQVAINAYRKALAINSNYAEAYNNLGTALKEQGDLQAATDAYRQALAINPNLPDVYSNLGIALKEQGNLRAAVDSYQQALVIKPHYPQAYFNLGIVLHEQGDLQAAINVFCQALAIKPNYPAAYNNLGIVLQDQGNLQAAINSYRQALAINPDYPDAYNNLGNALQDQGNLQAAVDSYRQALAINSDSPKVNFNLGNALKGQDNLQVAIDAYRQALAINPNHPEAHWNLSLVQLLLGDYESGWKGYEWRFQAKGNPQPHAHPQVERWTGSNLAPEENLILVSEQGLGDTLQFMRYVLYLNKTGVPASLCAKTKLHSLIRASEITTVIYSPEQANQLTTGKWLPLLSLPGYLQVRPDHPIVNTPYIKAPEKQVDHWRRKLAIEKQPIIGINWSGNLRSAPSGKRKDWRSLPLEVFAPIVETITVTLLSLQKGDGSEQLADCSFRHRFVGCQEDIHQAWDFVETAAIIANCKLVITSDTAVAHLAAGMGHPTWLLLVKASEWRWGREGESSFWYPSMRLFRQREQGNWAEVMERVATALEALLSHPKGTSHQELAECPKRVAGSSPGQPEAVKASQAQ